jgi:hypothetical protein
METVEGLFWKSKVEALFFRVKVNYRFCDQLILIINGYGTGLKSAP